MAPKKRDPDWRRRERGRVKGCPQLRPSMVTVTMTTISAPRRRRRRNRRRKSRRWQRDFPWDPNLSSIWVVGTC